MALDKKDVCMIVYSTVKTMFQRLVTHRTSGAFKEAIWGYFFTLPWLIGFVVFSAGPICAVIYFGFTRYDILSSAYWIGLKNYSKMLYDPLFWKSLYNTVYFVFFSVSLRMFLGFILALLVNRNIKGITIIRSIFYLPVVVPIVATSMLWCWILQPHLGVINYLSELLGLPHILWIVTERWSKPSIVLVSLWTVGETMVIFLAGLQNVPEQLYEAAEIDGTGPWNKLIRITIPMLTPTIFFNLIISIINSFQVFAFAYIITGGGPLDSTLFYVLYIFQQGFKYFHMGYASALAVILLLLVVSLTIYLFRSSESWVYYEAERK